MKAFSGKELARLLRHLVKMAGLKEADLG